MLKSKFSTQFKWLIVIFILLSITIVILILKFAQKNRNKKNQSFEKITEVIDEQDITLSWATYTDEKLGFSFKHPDLDDSCCTMGGPASEEIVFGKAYVDTDTLNPEIPDESFAGVAIYIIGTNKKFEQYIADEKEALLLQKKDYILYMSENKEGFNKKFVDDSIEEKSIINNREFTVLKHYSWDDIDRYYFPFPNENHILVLGKSSKKSDKFTFEQIFSTFEFIDIQQ